MPLGSIRIGDSFEARLTPETVAAVHELVSKCGVDGRTFTLTFAMPNARTSRDFEIGPDTEISFSYSAIGIDSGLITSQAAKLLDAVILDGRVVVVVPGE